MYTIILDNPNEFLRKLKERGEVELYIEGKLFGNFVVSKVRKKAINVGFVPSKETYLELKEKGIKISFIHQKSLLDRLNED